jgi:hypothetical protein
VVEMHILLLGMLGIVVEQVRTVAHTPFEVVVGGVKRMCSLAPVCCQVLIDSVAFPPHHALTVFAALR